MTRNLKIVWTLIIIFLITAFGLAQETITYDHQKTNVDLAFELDKLSLSGIAMDFFEEEINNPLFEFKEAKISAELQKSKEALLLKLENAENNLNTVLKNYSSSSEVKKLYPVLANHYFAINDFGQALKFYERINATNVTAKEKQEHHFKKGYCQLIKKDFAGAQRDFNNSTNSKFEYYEHGVYYLGITNFFLNQRKQALANFEKLKGSKFYAKHVPYYIVQFYFDEGDFAKTITYGESVLNKAGLENKEKIHLLVGQAYYKKQDFEQALFHLEAYNEASAKLRKEEFFLLAFLQYRANKLDAAIDNFKEISRTKDSLGQYANYYLADCMLKTNDKKSARSAFKNASTFSYSQSVKEQSAFYYSKLSMEQGFDAEALQGLSKINPASPYHTESQKLLAALFLRTTDYQRSIATIEGMTNRSSEVNAAYKTLALKAGKQAVIDKKYKEAFPNFDKANSIKVLQELNDEILFWQAYAYLKDGQFQKAQPQFETLAKKPHSSQWIDKSNYYLGYIHLEKNKLKKALNSFESYLIASNTEAQIALDARLRAADCAFALNQYSKANEHYSSVAMKKGPNANYALYQSAIIQGLSGDQFEKILSLEELLKRSPNSAYADNAYYHIGNAYHTLGKNAEAFESYQELINLFQEQSPLVNKALLKLGLSSYNQGDLSNALKFYKKVMLNNPTSAESTEAMLAIEEIYVNDLNELNQYMDYLKKIPGMDLSNREKDSLNFKISELQFEEGEYSKAIISLETYLKKYPKGKSSLDALFMLAESYTFTKSYSNALLRYDQIISLGMSGYQETSLKKAATIAYNHEEAYAKAYKYYTQLMLLSEKQEQYDDFHFKALQSAYKANKLPEAAGLSEKLIVENKRDKEDLVVAHFIVGKHALSIQDNGRVISSFNYVVRNNNAALAAESSYLLSELYFNIGNLEQAEQQCKSTNTVSSNYPFWIARSLLLLSEIYMAKDDLYNARAATEAVIENFTEDEAVLLKANEKLEQIKIREEVKSRLLPKDNDLNQN